MNVINLRFKELGLRGRPGVKHLKRLAKTQLQTFKRHPRASAASTWLLRALSFAIVSRRQKKAKTVTMRPGDHTGPRGGMVFTKKKGIFQKMVDFFKSVFRGGRA